MLLCMGSSPMSSSVPELQCTNWRMHSQGAMCIPGVMRTLVLSLFPGPGASLYSTVLPAPIR